MAAAPRILFADPRFSWEPFVSFWSCKHTKQILLMWTSHDHIQSTLCSTSSYPHMLECGRMRCRQCSSYPENCQGAQQSPKNTTQNNWWYTCVLPCFLEVFFSAGSIQIYFIKLMHLETRNFATPSFLFVSERGPVSESFKRFIPSESETKICTFQREICNHSQMG